MSGRDYWMKYEEGKQMWLMAHKATERLRVLMDDVPELNDYAIEMESRVKAGLPIYYDGIKGMIERAGGTVVMLGDDE